MLGWLWESFVSRSVLDSSDAMHVLPNRELPVLAADHILIVVGSLLTMALVGVGHNAHIVPYGNATNGTFCPYSRLWNAAPDKRACFGSNES